MTVTQQARVNKMRAARALLPEVYAAYRAAIDANDERSVGEAREAWTTVFHVARLMPNVALAVIDEILAATSTSSTVR